MSEVSSFTLRDGWDNPADLIGRMKKEPQSRWNWVQGSPQVFFGTGIPDVHHLVFFFFGVFRLGVPQLNLMLLSLMNKIFLFD